MPIVVGFTISISQFCSRETGLQQSNKSQRTKFFFIPHRSSFESRTDMISTMKFSRYLMQQTL